MTVCRRIVITSEEYLGLRFAINNLEYDVTNTNGQLNHSEIAKKALDECKFILGKIEKIAKEDIWLK